VLLLLVCQEVKLLLLLARLWERAPCLLLLLLRLQQLHPGSVRQAALQLLLLLLLV
jgi:hypothetical protein